MKYGTLWCWLFGHKFLSSEQYFDKNGSLWDLQEADIVVCSLRATRTCASDGVYGKQTMRRKFWLFVHDRLEDAWHWVYYHKLAPPVTLPPIGNVQYNITYMCGKTGVVSFDPPVKPRTENVQDAR